MSKIFTRSKLNPVLKPNPKNSWEAKKLYNPGVIFYNNKFHLFYRAVGNGNDWKSAIGYAVSNDGEIFQRFPRPILCGTKKSEHRGLEDPRITKVGDTFYMAYATFDGITTRLNIATSTDLKKWQKQGPSFSKWNFNDAGGIRVKWDENGNVFTKPKLTEWSKSGAIFPEKINGKFWMMFGEYNIWLASSEDGIKWRGDKKPFLFSRPGKFFDNTFVEMGPPPIKTRKGWLVLYHGINKKHVYQIGFLLLAINNPRKIIYRSEKAIFKPEKDYEMSGMVDVLPGGLEEMQKLSKHDLEKFLNISKRKGVMPKVVFCCGATLKDDTLRIFYGAGDSVICTATADINDFLNYK